MLVRKDQGWAIAGKDEIKPLTETVNDTLGAFAALRLERFVADKGVIPNCLVWTRGNDH